ncbi:hypothetical protein D3C80_1768960 [compost metagenome]
MILGGKATLGRRQACVGKNQRPVITCQNLQQLLKLSLPGLPAHRVKQPYTQLDRPRPTISACAPQRTEISRAYSQTELHEIPGLWTWAKTLPFQRAVPALRDSANTLTPRTFEIGKGPLTLSELSWKAVDAGTNNLDHSAKTSSAV